MRGIQLNCQKYTFHRSLSPPFQKGLGGFLVLTLSLLYSFTSPAQYAPIGQFQLAPPAIEVTNTFFEESATINLDLDVKGVELRYSLTGEEVTAKSTLYEGPITLSHSTTIKARAFHSDYHPSEVVQSIVFRRKTGTLNVTYSSDPAPQYAGQGAVSLTDFQKGSMNFRDGHWLGFSVDTLIFEVNTETEVRQLHLSVLEDHGSWIFSPEQVEVWQGSKLIGKWEGKTPKTFLSKSFQFIDLPVESSVPGTLELKVITGKIPDWHDGKGTTPWLFIDEIFISN